MAKNIFCGRTADIPYADFMDLINRSFGFSTPETQFLGLLPKLYREEHRPQEQNYIVTEDGVLCTAVGAYDHALTVGGDILPCRGIGNVATHPDYRARGYMRLAMEAALDDMIRDRVALSYLGGRRHRYRYFSYEKAGECYTFSLNRDNLRHVWKDESAPFDTVRAVVDPDDPILECIKAISDAGQVAPVRARKDFLDISRSWHADLLMIAHQGGFKGYAILGKEGSISELRTIQAEDFLPALRSVLVYTERFSVTLTLPPFEAEAIAALMPVCEGVTYGCSMMYSVLDYGRVMKAFMNLKATYAALPDGEITLLIHGRGGDERLTVRVSEGAPSVTVASDTTPAELELSHCEAMEALFAPVSPLRDTLPACCRLWFPLPLWIYRADGV